MTTCALQAIPKGCFHCLASTENKISANVRVFRFGLYRHPILDQYYPGPSKDLGCTEQQKMCRNP